MCILIKTIKIIVISKIVMAITIGKETKINDNLFKNKNMISKIIKMNNN